MLRRTAVLGVSAALALTALPAIADVVDLGLPTDFRVDGAEELGRTGVSVAAAGDVNGDTIDDWVVSAPFASPRGRSLAGSVFVIFGERNPPGVLDLAALGDRGFRIDGAEPGDTAGRSLAPAGDLNRDGFDDFIMGVTGVSVPGRPEVGAAYVVFGSGNPADLDLADRGNRAIRINGPTTDSRTGTAVAGIGDFNNDGLDDVLVGASNTTSQLALLTGAGTAYVVLGRPTPEDVDLGVASDSVVAIEGTAASMFLGAAVHGPGDLNRDGIDDIVLGAPGADFNGRTDAGGAFVVFGAADSRGLTLNNLVGRAFRIDGAVINDGMGATFASGDLNGDDLTDLILSGPDAGTGLKDEAGAVHVVFGRTQFDRVDLADAAAPAIRIVGPSAEEEMGTGLAAVDLNGDSIDDLAIGGGGADNNGRPSSGSTYVIFGGSGLTSRDLADPGTVDRRFDGARASDRSGRALAAIGDVNDDAGEDLAISAEVANNNGRNSSGSVYVEFGAPIVADPPPVVTPAATLTVKARSAKKKIPRTGRVKLVRAVTVGNGQQARIKVTVKPRKTKKKVRIITSTRTVTVKTRKAPKGNVTVRITATGTGVTPTTFTRTWRVR